MYLIIAILIIYIGLMNNNYYVSPSLGKLKISVPENYLYYVFYIRFGRCKLNLSGGA
jgi:hypothetical protein